MTDPQDRYSQLSPCASCPYRCDAPLAMWSKVEFDNLRAQDANEMGGRAFDCHQGKAKPHDSRSPCIGWLLDQRERGVQSIQLRLTLMTQPKAAEHFRQISPGKHKLYANISEMIEANYPGGRDRPRPTSGSAQPHRQRAATKSKARKRT